MYISFRALNRYNKNSTGSVVGAVKGDFTRLKQQQEKIEKDK